MHFEAFASQYTLPIWLPFFAAIITGVLSYINRPARHFFTVLALLVNVVLGVGLLIRVASGTGEISPSETLGQIAVPGVTNPVALRIVVDPAGALTMLVIGLVAWAATASLRPVFGRGLSYPLILIAVGLLNGAVLSDTLVMLICFLAPLPGVLGGLVLFEEQARLPEIGIAPPISPTPPSRWRRLLTFRLPEEAPDAAGMRIVVFLQTGVALLLFAALIGGELKDKRLNLAALPPDRSGMIIFCMLGALLAWSAAVPWHSWLVKAQGRTAATVAACLSGATISMGLLWLARIFSTLDSGLLNLSIPLPGFYTVQTLLVMLDWRFLLVASGALTTLGASAGALLDRRIGHVLAYAALCQIGLTVLALGAAMSISGANLTGFMIVMMAIPAQALGITLLFLCAGAVAYRIRESDLQIRRPIATELPLTLIAAIIAALSVAGLPPFFGFVPRWMSYELLLQSPDWEVRFMLLLAVLGHVFLGAALARLILGLFMIEQPVFFKRLAARGNRLKPPVILTPVRVPPATMLLAQQDHSTRALAYPLEDEFTETASEREVSSAQNGAGGAQIARKPESVAPDDATLPFPAVQPTEADESTNRQPNPQQQPPIAPEPNTGSEPAGQDGHQPPFGSDRQVLGSTAGATTGLPLPEVRFGTERLDLLWPMIVIVLLLLVLGLVPQLIAVPLTQSIDQTGHVAAIWGWDWKQFTFAGTESALIAGVLVLLGLLGSLIFALARPALESFTNHPYFKYVAIMLRGFSWLLSSGWLDLYRIARLIVMALAGAVAAALDATLGRATR